MRMFYLLSIARMNNNTETKPSTYQPIKIVKVGFIGLGTRGMRAIHRFLHLEGVEIVGLADTVPDKIRNAQQIISDYNHSNAKEFPGPEGWKEICSHPDINLIYICTDWLSHTPISVYALEQGKNVAVEVPATTTIDECWQLVETVERTGLRFMMLENCCYDLFELTTLNMIRQGLFGEIMHGEGAYIHDIRELIFASSEKGGFQNYWHRDFNTNHSGNTYPTHGLGPVCLAMSINRGDRMKTLVSMSTRQAGLTAYAQKHFGISSKEANQTYKLGDFSTTIIQTEKEHTILLKNSMSIPQPYSRVYSLNGTKGYLVKYPDYHIALEPDSDVMLSEKRMEELLERYKHPYIQKTGDKAIDLCGKRARDYIMDFRLIYCMHEGLPFDLDVYDAAAWSAIIELTEKSVLNGSVPVEIPDFTRGNWQTKTPQNS